MWALATLILQMIKFFSISLKLFAVEFDVLFRVSVLWQLPR